MSAVIDVGSGKGVDEAVCLYESMADPVTLIILVAAGEAASPGAAAMAQATRDALTHASVEVRETPGVPTDEDARTIEESSRPDAVVELIWDDPDHRRVTLRVHMVRARRWLERSMAYAPTDP